MQLARLTRDIDTFETFDPLFVLIKTAFTHSDETLHRLCLQFEVNARLQILNLWNVRRPPAAQSCTMSCGQDQWFRPQKWQKWRIREGLFVKGAT